MKAELVPENGDPPIPITRDLTVVGRRSYCDIVIDHSSLSKRHCVLVKTDGLLVIRDLISTNGTKVKGQKIRWAALLPDDRIALGSYKLRVYLGPDDAATPSERYRARAGAQAGAVADRGSLLSGRDRELLPRGQTGSGFDRGEFAAPSPLEIAVEGADVEALLGPPPERDDSGMVLPIVLDGEDRD
jgi:predicted component of type VI protein secretion system